MRQNPPKPTQTNPPQIEPCDISPEFNDPNPAIMLPRLLLKLFAIDARLASLEQKVFEHVNRRGTSGGSSGGSDDANN